MPTLPSGARLWLSMEAILAPGRLFHPCPADRFWYRDLDPLAGWTSEDDDPPPQRWTTAVVPETRLDAAAFVRVLLAGPRDETRRWRGDWLLTLEKPGMLTDDDWEALLEFLATDRTIAFLDLVLDRCRRQAERRTGRADLEGFEPAVHGEPGLRPRLLRAMRATERLADRIDVACREGRFESEHEARLALESLAEAAETIAASPVIDRGLAHRVAAAASSHLGRVDAAADHARAYRLAMPGDHAFDAIIDHRLGRRGLVGFG